MNTTMPDAIAPAKPAGTITIKRSLRERLNSPQNSEASAATRDNRLALLLDASGSMSGDKNQSLRDAVTSFIQACDFSTTALALDTFGAEPELHIPLTCSQPLLLMTAMTIPASGGTPMDEAMSLALASYSLTRAVLVSDGCPDSESAAYAVAENYKRAELPVDCVHIGHSSQGEACLWRIAELTGGKFIKFTDIASFAKNFKYLTPAYYAQLTSGAVGAGMLGAQEIK